MDPDVVLNEAVHAATRVLGFVDKVGNLSEVGEWDIEKMKEFVTYAERVALNLTDLDEWIRNNGFMPDRWRRDLSHSR